MREINLDFIFASWKSTNPKGSEGDRHPRNLYFFLFLITCTVDDCHIILIQDFFLRGHTEADESWYKQAAVYKRHIFLTELFSLPFFILWPLLPGEITALF